MSDSLRSLVEEHRTFYEVLPYIVVVEEKHGDLRTGRRVQAGFDVDVYFVRVDGDALAVPPAPEYALGYGALKRITEEISRETADACSLEVIPFPSTIFADVQDQARVSAKLRIRISHWGVDQPADLVEHRALQEVERRLKALGATRR
jgi:hypothetical protein